MKDQNFTYKYKSSEYNFIVPPQSFTPTSTSFLLLETLIDQRDALNFQKTLDLGCGIGFVAIMLSKLKVNSNLIFGSDISEMSINAAKENAKNLIVDSEFRCGSLFDPWKNEKFDLIINDVSGISEKVLSLSDWFKNVPQATGEDGTTLTSKVIEESINYLAPSGKMITPILGLQNQDELIKKLGSVFNNFSLINEMFWPLSKELTSHIEELKKLDKMGMIELDQRYNLYGWWTRIYLGET